MATEASGPALGLAAASFLTMLGALAAPSLLESPTPAPAPTSSDPPPGPGARVAPEGGGFELTVPPPLTYQVRRSNLRRLVLVRHEGRAVFELDSSPLVPWIQATDIPMPAPWHTDRRAVVRGVTVDFGGDAWVWLGRPQVLLLVGAGRLLQIKADWTRPEALAVLRSVRARPGAELRNLGGNVMPDAVDRVRELAEGLTPGRRAALPRALVLGIERVGRLDARDASILYRHLSAHLERPGPPDPTAAPAPQACARCHSFPPPTLLPRARWAKTIGEMTEMPTPDGVRPLSAAEVGAAIRYYTARAPASLPVRPPSPAPGSRFAVTRERPSQLIGTPGATHVTIADGVVSVLHVRSASLFRRRGGGWTKIAGGLHAPARMAPYGRAGDLLIAGLGAVNPTDRRVGRVSLLPAGTPHCRAIGDDLGRTSDAQAADLDGDGDLDVIVAAFGFRTAGGLELLIRNGEAFSRRTLDARDGFVRAAPLDVDRDGTLDVVALLAQEHEQVVWYRNEGDLRFAPPAVLYRAPHPGWGFAAMEVVDLDRDGDPDLLLANGDSLDTRDLLRADHGVAWLQNLGGGRFAHHAIGPLYGATAAAAGDLDGDGDLDVVASSFLPLVPADRVARLKLDSVVWFEQAGATWRRRVLEQGRCVHPTVAIGDLSGDGKPDVVAGEFPWREMPTGDARPLVTIFTQR